MYKKQIATDKKVITFGEVMLRLTAPDFLRFSQTNQMIATYGGSEANVAVSLANFGISTEFVTRHLLLSEDLELFTKISYSCKNV